MARTQYTNEEIGQLAEQIYRRSIRDKVMPQHKGKFLIVDIESGDYEVDEDDLAAEDRLRARRPNGVFFGLRAMAMEEGIEFPYDRKNFGRR